MHPIWHMPDDRPFSPLRLVHCTMIGVYLWMFLVAMIPFLPLVLAFGIPVLAFVFSVVFVTMHVPVLCISGKWLRCCCCGLYCCQGEQHHRFVAAFPHKQPRWFASVVCQAHVVPSVCMLAPVATHQQRTTMSMHAAQEGRPDLTTTSSYLTTTTTMSRWRGGGIVSTER